MKRWFVALAAMGAMCYAQEPGRFIFVDQSDPITDVDKSFIYVSANEADLYDDPRLYFCCDDNALEIFYAPDEFLTTNDSVTVQYRFDDEPASSEQQWSGSTSGTATFANSSQRRTFLAGAQASEQVVMLAADYNGVTHSYTFSLVGFTDAFAKLSCAPSVEETTAASITRSITSGLPTAAIYSRIKATLDEGSFTEDVNVIYAQGLTIRFEVTGDLTTVALEGGNAVLRENIVSLFVTR